jgi:hypothetical protein
VLQAGASQCRLRTADGNEIPLATRFTTREREVLLAGGLLAHLRSGGGAFGIHRGRSGAVDQGSPITSPLEDDLD